MGCQANYGDFKKREWDQNGDNYMNCRTLKILQYIRLDSGDKLYNSNFYIAFAVLCCCRVDCDANNFLRESHRQKTMSPT